MFNGVDKALLKTSNNCTFIGSKRLSTTKKRGGKRKEKKRQYFYSWNTQLTVTVTVC